VKLQQLGRLKFLIISSAGKTHAADSNITPNYRTSADRIGAALRKVCVSIPWFPDLCPLSFGCQISKCSIGNNVLPCYGLGLKRCLPVLLYL
jgi:hypothetical protein